MCSKIERCMVEYIKRNDSDERTKMYQSQQYLEIGGKFIVSPFAEEENMYGVNLHGLMCQLHESGAQHITDFKTIIMSTIECKIGLEEMDKAAAIYKRVIVKLSELGVTPKVTTH